MKICFFDDDVRFVRTMVREVERRVLGAFAYGTTCPDEVVARAHEFDLLFIDLQLTKDHDNRGGFDVICRLRAPHPTIVVLSGHDRYEDRLRSLELGAVHHWLKGRETRIIIPWIKAFQAQRLGTSYHPPLVNRLVGQSAAIRRLKEQLLDAGLSHHPVLITGETGTGKEVVASILHEASRRDPLVAVNCGGLTDSLTESELFGHERGAFTGAIGSHRGLLAETGDGTLFLDELGTLTLRNQVKLLRVLDGGRFRPLGAHHDVDFHGRVIAASNDDLRARVADRSFREDLYYRIATFEFHVPPLRERREDVPLLLEHFVARNGTPFWFTDEALETLVRYPWPGNVRELSAKVERLGTMFRGGDIGVEQVRQVLPSPTARACAKLDEALEELVDDPNRGAVPPAEFVASRLHSVALRKTQGNVRAAARLLHVDRRALKKG